VCTSREYASVGARARTLTGAETDITDMDMVREAIVVCGEQVWVTENSYAGSLFQKPKRNMRKKGAKDK